VEVIAAFGLEFYVASFDHHDLRSEEICRHPAPAFEPCLQFGAGVIPEG
jgi:hypothetical protein